MNTHKPKFNPKMKKSILLSGSAVAMAALAAAPAASAQDETVTVVEETALVSDIPCKTHYYSGSGDNWFIQIGAGIASPFMEDHPAGPSPEHHITVNYNFGFGKWMSPYLGWRLSFYGGPLHWQNVSWEKSKYVNANFDLMWDMFNSLGGVNPNRVFSIIPFVGIGGEASWRFRGAQDGFPTGTNVLRDHHERYGSPYKRVEWTLPVTAGLQFRFRLCKYVDFFAEARAAFYADNWNNQVGADAIDALVQAMGGFNFNIGGRGWNKFNECNYVSQIAALNGQVNDLRAQLVACGQTVAALQAQLPCPEVVAPECPDAQAPLLSTVRFTINSAKITSTETVNVYNIAQWMKANPNSNVVIKGYADKDTGTASYNMKLSERRAQNVYNMLTKEYGIPADRLTIKAEGSDSQVYDVNNWNRIVIFSQN